MDNIWKFKFLQSRSEIVYTIEEATLQCYAVYVETMEVKNNSSIQSVVYVPKVYQHFLKKKPEINWHLD